MYNRWAIYIDIEGFSYSHLQSEALAIKKLSKLMHDIYRIGSSIFNSEPNRLFVHQMGDSFLIVNSIAENEKDLNRLISIVAALMQSALQEDFVLKSAISYGDFGDIQSLYPRDILEQKREGTSIYMGEGILNIFPVMGSVLIRAVTIHKKSRSGPILSIDKTLLSQLPEECDMIFERDELFEINWLTFKNTITNQIHKEINKSIPQIAELRKRLKDYITEYDLKDEWIDSAKKLLE